MIATHAVRGVTIQSSKPTLGSIEAPKLCASETLIAIKPLLVGICSSDLRELAGSRPVSSDFGHEIVGIVDSIDGPCNRRVGERVVCNPNIGLKRTSGFAETVYGQGNPTNIDKTFRPIPRDLTNVEAVFVEPMACACRCVNQCADPKRLTNNPEAAVIGAGLFGVLIALRLRTEGFRVTLVNRSLHRLSYLETVGLFDSGSIEMQILSDPKRDKFDTVIIAATTIDQALMDHALSLVKDGGEIILFGGTRPGQELQIDSDITIDVDILRRSEQNYHLAGVSSDVDIIGTHGADQVNFNEAVETIINIRSFFSVTRFISGFVSLVELPNKLSELKRRPSPGKWILDLT